MNAESRVKPKGAQTVEQVLDDMDASRVSIHCAMAAAFAEIEGATKSATNPHFKSKYADIGKVIDAIKPALINHGLFFTQRNHPSEDGVIVETVVGHSSGAEMSLGRLFVPALKKDAQGFGSALTYARRYALLTAFGVPTEDDDGNDAGRDDGRPRTGAARPDNSAETPDPKPTDKEKDTDFSATALRGSIKTLVRNINGCGSLSDLEELLESPAAQDVIDQCSRRFPAWWETAEGCPPEFTPLKKLIDQTREGLAELETA
jgi:hypothetical protein